MNNQALSRIKLVEYGDTNVFYGDYFTRHNS